VVADNFGLFVTWILIAVGLLALAISGPTIERERLPAGEYYALMLFAIAGMMLMATASDLLVIFLALEILSLAVYVLTGIRASRRRHEAAFKYFLLGAFRARSSSTGSRSPTADRQHAARSRRQPDGRRRRRRRADAAARARAAAGRLRVQGVGGAVPHVDARRLRGRAAGRHRLHVHRREGGGVRRVRRACSSRRSSRSRTMGAGHLVIAAATMIVGTVVGVAQTNVKRMLAYSSIAHGGYLLMALLAANDVGKGAILFYLLAYAITNVGAFGVIALLESTGAANDHVQDYAGLAGERPVLAAFMTIFLLSLGGFPPMAGFIAKWYVFTAAIKAGYVWLAIIVC
jgi:NADH-quinone oxidoreductase subunit N